MAKNLMKLHRSSKGFTLVELMIVVAIIGILAAIAIPQFAAYRIRGFNSSALSDTKNLQTSEAAYFADHQIYAATIAAPTAATRAAVQAGTPLLGPQTLATSVISQFVGNAIRTVGISIGNQVTVNANHNAGATASNFGSKHLQGDTVYGADSDSTVVYSNASLLGVNNALVAGSVIAAVVDADEYQTAGGNWVGK